MNISDLIYQVKCFFKPHNVVKLSHLPKTWCDRDWLMFHAMFQILVDFVELEQPFTWEKSSTKRFTDREAMCKSIARMFTDEYVTEHYFYEDINEEEKLRLRIDAISRASIYEDIFKLYCWYVDKEYEIPDEAWETLPSHILMEMEDRTNKECELMLQRILSIRPYLWT